MSENKRKVMAGLGQEETIEVNHADSVERQQFVAQLSKFDKSVTIGLLNGTLQAQDEFLVATREETGTPKSFDLFQTSDKIVKGMFSLSEAKVKQDTLIQSIVIGYSQAATGTYEETDVPNELLNGELEIKIESGTVLSIPMAAFRIVKNNLASSGKYLEYPLKNQKAIRKDQILSAKIELSTALKAPTSGKVHAVRIGVAGIKVTNNTIQ